MWTVIIVVVAFVALTAWYLAYPTPPDFYGD